MDINGTAYNPLVQLPQVIKPTQQTTVTQISPCAIRRIIQLTVPIQFAEIRFTDNLKRDVTQQCLYSWSTDSLCWTNWVTYQQYLQLARSIESDFYLRILIFGGIGTLTVNGLATECYTVCLDSQNQFLVDFCGNPNLFDPYANLDCALMLQQQLSDTVICMLGIPAYYFRVIPDKETVDWTFKEYILHSVESVKYVKLMCQDGALPSSRPQMTEFDFDWDNDWEVEMSKTAFAGAFGDTVFPKQRDLIYVPMMKRMYEVNSAYDEKNEGLMWRSTTWKLALVKYNDKDNVSEGSYEELIDTLVENQYMDMWAGIEQNEQTRQSGEHETEQPQFAATNLYNMFISDNIRLNVTTDVDILDKQINNGSATVVRNQYSGKTSESSITYQKPMCGPDGTVLIQLSVPSGNEIHSKLGDSVSNTLLNAGEVSLMADVTVTETVKIENNRRITEYPGVMQLTFNGMTAQVEIDPYEGKNLIVAMRWHRQNFVTEMSVYESRCKARDMVGRLKQSNWSFDFVSPVSEQTTAYNNDFNQSCGQVVSVRPYPVQVGYVKLFNTYLDNKRVAIEASKYTTTSDDCVINDLARPIYGDHGYNVR